MLVMRLKKMIRAFSAVVLAGFMAASATLTAKADFDISATSLELYEISMSDVDTVGSLQAKYLARQIEKGLDPLTIDLDTLVIEVEGLDLTSPGLQKVTVSMSVPSDENDVSLVNMSSEDILVKFVYDKTPQILLTSVDSVAYLDYEGLEDYEFNPIDYLAYINDASGVMPVISIESDVDTSAEGEYFVTYKAVNINGLTTEKTMTVHVEKSPQQIADEEEAARKAAEEAARKAAEEEAARKAAEEAAKKAAAIAAAQNGSTALSKSWVTSGNPYSGGWTNCTWSCWTIVKTNTGISLPQWGDARYWYNNAAASGYTVSKTPRVNSIVVKGNHVAYVYAVEGDYIYVSEGGYLKSYGRDYNERKIWIYNSAITGYIYL